MRSKLTFGHGFDALKIPHGRDHFVDLLRAFGAHENT